MESTIDAVEPMFCSPLTTKFRLQEIRSQYSIVFAQIEINLYLAIGEKGNVSKDAKVNGIVKIHIPTRKIMDLK
ncbi:MAG: hypothetical protein ACKN9X_06545 [Candidatus Methylopumilus sp.]